MESGDPEMGGLGEGMEGVGEMEEIVEEVEALKAILGQDLVTATGAGGAECVRVCVCVCVEGGASLQMRVPFGYPRKPCAVAVFLPSECEGGGQGKETERAVREMSRAKAAAGEPCLYDLVLGLKEALERTRATTARATTARATREAELRKEVEEASAVAGVSSMSDGKVGPTVRHSSIEGGHARRALVRIDHMRRPKRYVRWLAHAGRSAGLHGMAAGLYAVTGQVYLCLDYAGPAAGSGGRGKGNKGYKGSKGDKGSEGGGGGGVCPLRRFLVALRTERVDVDSRGKPCKERMAEVLDDRLNCSCPNHQCQEQPCSPASGAPSPSRHAEALADGGCPGLVLSRMATALQPLRGAGKGRSSGKGGDGRAGSQHKGCFRRGSAVAMGGSDGGCAAVFRQLAARAPLLDLLFVSVAEDKQAMADWLDALQPAMLLKPSAATPSRASPPSSSSSSSSSCTAASRCSLLTSSSKASKAPTPATPAGSSTFAHWHLFAER